MISLVLTIALFVFVAAGICWTMLSSSRFARMSWEEIIAELQPVQSQSIAAVTARYLRSEHASLLAEPNELWNSLGGQEGLTRMRGNAEVLLALAAYAQQWNPQQSVLVSEQMRQDALALRRAVRAVTWARLTGLGQARAALYLHRATTAYATMSHRLIDLYAASPARRQPRLAALLSH